MSHHPALETGEIILRKSNGNFRQDSFNPFDWSGGKWFLTNKRILFESNWTNPETKMEAIKFHDISSVGLKHHDFLSSKLSIFLENGSIIELHIKERRKWVKDIINAINSIRTSPDEAVNEDKFINVENQNRSRGRIFYVTMCCAVIVIIIFIIQFSSLSIINK